ncbi:hypothetical protein ABFS83_01G036400 [Erythranthe nasuta]
MAVTQNSDGDSKPPKERCQSGQSAINKDVCGMAKSYKLRRKRNRSNESDSLSDIDDAEVSGYLNTTEEFHLKKIMWEAMNRNHTQAKKQKRKPEKKKDVSVKEAAAKTTKEVEVPKRSSKINYDALKLLNDELDQEGCETAGNTPEDSYARRTENSSDRNIGRGSNESSYYEDDQTFGGDDNETYYESEEEHLDFDECW